MKTPNPMVAVADDHDCERYSASDFETGEEICLKCGMVIREPDNRDNYVLNDLEARSFAAFDHYAGNALLNSETENMDYVSTGNKGLAYRYNGGSRDFQNKKVKTRLNFAYQAGNIIGKAMVMREDPLTGEGSLKFNGYDKPILTMVKECATSELSRYNLSTVELTIIAKECKRIVSRLFFAELLEYAWMAAAINSGVLKEKDARQIEQRMYGLIEPIRIKLLSHCDKALMEELTKLASQQQQQPIEAKQ